MTIRIITDPLRPGYFAVQHQDACAWKTFATGYTGAEIDGLLDAWRMSGVVVESDCREVCAQ